MPFIDTNKIPQDIEPIKTTDILDLMAILPRKLDYDLNVWVGGKMGQYGITTGNLIFYIEQDEEPTTEQKEYFNSLVEPLGINATCSEQWRLERGQRLYNLGKKLPRFVSATHVAPILTIMEFTLKLPPTVPFDCPIDLTGGLLKNGWSANDGDLIVEDESVPNQTLRDIGRYFTALMGWRFDVGRKCMDERANGEVLKKVYKAPLYRNTICQL